MSSKTNSIPSQQRILSIDALRGFDMFWILGADALVQAIHKIVGHPVTEVMARQMDHCEWEGFRFYDMIFPLFVYIAGISIVFSLSKVVEGKDSRGPALRRVFRRSLWLIGFGIICYGGLAGGWDQVRWVGVLQRIGLAYLATSILFCFLKPRGLVVACITLLVGYWALMTFVPIRDIRLDKAEFARLKMETGINDERLIFQNTTATVSGHYDPGYNLADHLDYQFLPGRKWNKYYDPEGLLSTLPAIATCLLGVLTGLLLRLQGWSDRRKVLTLAGAGMTCLLLGEVWGQSFPVIKNIWTSSFVLVAGGWSAMLLAFFYWVIDMQGWKHWATPFVWIGANAITAYMLVNLVDVRSITDRVVGGPIAAYLDTHIASGLGNVIGAGAALAAIILFVWYLYRRQIFLRL